MIMGGISDRRLYMGFYQEAYSKGLLNNCCNTQTIINHVNSSV